MAVGSVMSLYLANPTERPLDGTLIFLMATLMTFLAKFRIPTYGISGTHIVKMVGVTAIAADKFFLISAVGSIVTRFPAIRAELLIVVLKLTILCQVPIFVINIVM
jgi:hypothetical protein